jgi:hypothetical protein
MMRNFPKIFLRAWRAFEFSHGLREAVFLFVPLMLQCMSLFMALSVTSLRRTIMSLL